MKTLLLFVLAILLWFNPGIAAARPCDGCGGLVFYSHQVDKELRTSAVLNGDRHLKFKDYLKFEFDYKIYDNPEGMFGDLFEVRFGDQVYKAAVYLAYGGGCRLTFLDGSNQFGDFEISPEKELYDTPWRHLTFVFDRKNLSLTVESGGESLSCPLTGNISDEAFFEFGNCMENSPNDVASFAINDFTIWEKRDNPSYRWDFRKHGKNTTRDLLCGAELYVEHPWWMVDAYCYWTKEQSFTFKDCYLVQGVSDSLFIVSEDAVYYYDFQSDKLQIYGKSFSERNLNVSNSYIWNPEHSQLLYANPADPSRQYSVYNPVQGSWEPALVKDEKWASQNNMVWHAGSFYQLFGYGHFRYSDKITCFHPDGTALQLNEGQIAPRYLSAVGVNDGKLYICSGVGNEKGEQIQGIHIYNDFYSLDLSTGGITSLDDVVLPQNQVAAQNLCFNEDGSCYSLFYNPFQNESHLLLKKISLEGAEPVTYCDSIPYIFKDIYSEARLFPTTDKLFAVTKYKLEGGKTQLNIYSVRLPLLQEKDIMQEEQGLSRFWIIFLALLAGVVVLVFCLFRCWKRKHSVKILPQEVLANEELTMEPVQNIHENTAPGVYLLGGFRVINTEGEDITGEFTPVMKQLLCLIILFTVKDGRGVSNSQLKDILWMDKSDESAINNRSVNLRKIRLRLKNVGDFKLSAKNSYWKFIAADDARCDICEAVPFLLKFTEKNSSVTSSNIEDILRVTESGLLLPNQNFDFFDDLKSWYANLVLTVLNKALLITTDCLSRVLLAESILRFSPLDEEAIQIKCQALVSLGKIGMAKSAYDIFIRDYEIMMGESFPMEFDRLLKEQFHN